MEISVNGKTLKLQPHQVEHFERIKNILLKNHCYIDLSETGLGKTYIVMAIAMTFGFRLLVICPVIMISVWKKIAEEYGVSFIKINTERKDDAEDGILSYESLRSTKNHQPKHGLLSRSEDANGVSNFSATEKFTQIAKEGIFVVFDEVQKIKNSSDQYKACKTIAETCLEVGNQTRFALLSAMPVDKEIQIINIASSYSYDHTNINWF